MKNAGRGENKSPAFEFHWNLGVNPGPAPEGLQTYAVIFHDIENSSNKTTVDTLHWTAFNIPGTAKGLPEGLGAGDLPDGTRNGPGIAARGGNPGAYFGPGAGPGPIHHYVFEFYALDTKLDLPANTTREDLMKAMDGHVVGKAAWFGRFHAPPPPIRLGTVWTSNQRPDHAGHCRRARGWQLQGKGAEMESLIYDSDTSIQNLLDRGFEMPIHFAAVGTNGSVAAGTYEMSADGHGFDCRITVQASKPAGLTAPVNIMYVDGKGEAAVVVLGPLQPEPAETPLVV